MLLRCGSSNQDFLVVEQSGTAKHWFDQGAERQGRRRYEVTKVPRAQRWPVPHYCASANELIHKFLNLGFLLRTSEPHWISMSTRDSLSSGTTQMRWCHHLGLLWSHEDPGLKGPRWRNHSPIPVTQQSEPEGAMPRGQPSPQLQQKTKQRARYLKLCLQCEPGLNHLSGNFLSKEENTSGYWSHWSLLSECVCMCVWITEEKTQYQINWLMLDYFNSTLKVFWKNQ